MYINPFLAGILFTVGAELAIIFVAAVSQMTLKKNSDEEED